MGQIQRRGGGGGLGFVAHDGDCHLYYLLSFLSFHLCEQDQRRQRRSIIILISKKKGARTVCYER